MSEEKSTLFKKLVEIREKIPSLIKDGYNDECGYSFVTASTVVKTIRKEMDRLGVLLVPEITSQDVSFSGARILTKVSLKYTWIDLCDDSKSLVCQWVGQGVDTTEKGLAKALTNAEKYFLLKFFQIPTDEDDPDMIGGRKKTRKVKDDDYAPPLSDFYGADLNPPKDVPPF